MGVLQLDRYTEFKSNIKRFCNIDLSKYKEKQMKRRINSLMKRNDIANYESYFNILKQSKSHLEEFLDYITINVSEFFRNPSQWRVLRHNILPNIMANKKRIKVWSSACASGEEPYSLALLFKKLNILENTSILATDIDKQALQRAKKGVYNKKAVKNIPKDILNRYFIQKNKDEYIIKDVIKNKVNFKYINLLEDDFSTEYDLILCRNVMIYFTEKAKEKLYKKFYKALSDDGIFFVGSTEQIIMPQKYGFEGVKNFFYRKIKE